LAGAAGILLALPCVALGASLPAVSSGQRPGPPLLYAEPPEAPELSVQAPFRAPPLLVSGTDAYRDGEYLYQDYLFDDRGADTVGGPGSRGIQDPGNDVAAATAGDLFYPTDARFAGNGADLAELRIKPTADAIVYRLTFTTVVDPNVPIATIGIDTDRVSGQPDAQWPRGGGLKTPGVELFVTAWNGGGEVERPGGSKVSLSDVRVDARTNQMTISVPHSAGGDPGGKTWRYVAGVGLRGEGDLYRPVARGSSSDEEEPRSGSSTKDAPPVFNLGFRFDEPQTKVPLAGDPEDPYTTGPGIGNWYEDEQAKTLAGGTSGDFAAQVDFGRLAAGASQNLHDPPGDEQARIFASSLNLPEGVRGEFPGYGGRLQPYLLTVPDGVSPDRPAPLTWALHSLGGTYTQYKVFSPNQLDQFGDQRRSLVATPLGRGTDGWYEDEAEVDFFEVWRDIARHFNLDSERVALSGYSMGGYGTYKLGTHYPDLFGRAFTTVGPPARAIWPAPGVTPPFSDNGEPNQRANTILTLENARWLPYLNWVEVSDELVPYPGPRAQQARFDALGLRSQLWSFTPGEHFTLAAFVDQWGPARDFLGDARVTRDPSRVDYAFVPDTDRLRLGLRHDHGYWVSGLRVRNPAGDPGTNPARGEISARSLAFGEGDPGTRRVTSAGSLPGDFVPVSAYTAEGTDWTGVPRRSPENALELSLENVGSGTVDGARARLDGGRRLRVKLTSDGAGRVRLDLPLREGARAERVSGTAVSSSRTRTSALRAAAPEVALDREGATFTTAAGTREYVIDVADADTSESADDPAREQAGEPRGAGPPAAGGTAAGGRLPFTGWSLILVLLAGLVLGGTGAALKRRSS
jgi:hypothetical protein